MKIEPFYNKKEQKQQYRSRFQLNGKEFRPVADSRKKLLEIIDELRASEHRSRYDLPTFKHQRTVAELFAEHLRRLKAEGDRKKINRFEMVSERLLNILPPELNINEIKKAHFQKFIDIRLSEKNPQSEKFILPETVNKDLSALSVAFKNAARYFPEMEDAPVVQIPKVEIKKERRRERLVEKTGELDILLEYLRREHRNPNTVKARRRIADELEIKYETGLRRAEVAILGKHQYRREESALRDVKRLKTNTTTKFFPLTRRAVEIIESRLESETPFIFSSHGKPHEGDYKTLKYVCGKLNISYGSFVEGGFVPHDLRHNFASEIIQVTDIETAKSLTGHTGGHIMTYLHTDEKRMREAMNRREGFEIKEKLTELYNLVKDDKINLSAFLERAESLIKNG